MGEVSTIGLDIAKAVLQVHGVDADGMVVIRRRVGRAKVLEFFAGLPPCLVGMEACATAHQWGRELKKFGHDTRLMPPTYVKAYVKRGKNDAADAAAICEAVTRPSMRFVPIKSVEQQSALMLHRTRDLLIRQRTQLINALRAHLAELGLVAAKGHEGLHQLVTAVAESSDERLPSNARFACQAVQDNCRCLGRQLRDDPRAFEKHPPQRKDQLRWVWPGRRPNDRKGCGRATEADESGASIEAIQGALTHTKIDTTWRYLRRRSTKIAEVAAARSSKRAADRSDGTT